MLPIQLGIINRKFTAGNVIEGIDLTSCLSPHAVCVIFFRWLVLHVTPRLLAINLGMYHVSMWS